MIYEKIKNEKIIAMKAHKKERVLVLSNMINEIQKAAIPKNAKDTRKEIDDDLTVSILLKYKKTVQDMIDTCPNNRTDKMAEYQNEMNIVNEFAPRIETNVDEIRKMINVALKSQGMNINNTNKKIMIPYIMGCLKGHADLKIVKSLINEFVE